MWSKRTSPLCNDVGDVCVIHNGATVAGRVSLCIILRLLVIHDGIDLALELHLLVAQLPRFLKLLHRTTPSGSPHTDAQLACLPSSLTASRLLR